MISASSRLPPLLMRPWFGPLVVAILATAAVSAALDPAGDYPSQFDGPGLTIDEIFNVDLGSRMADRLLSGDVSGTIRAGRSLPDHPPLARLWLGLWHESVILIAPPRGEHASLVIDGARMGSAVAFGILIWLIGYTAARWGGNVAGWGAAIGLVLMPRVFGHAHLAALETFLNLTFAWAVISVAVRWSHPQPPKLSTAALCGVWLGLALLTKIQAIFLPIPIALWAVINWRHRALLPLLVWGLVGLAVFVCGWPWLWLDPVGNLLKYLGHASERSAIQVWYGGHALADNQVPWHYPWVLFATTVPLGLHFLAVWGVFHRRSTTDLQVGPRLSANGLLLGMILFPLIVFSLPGIAVYDGERLFLIVYPLWSIFVGRGLAACHEWLCRRFPQRVSTALLGLLLVCQSFGLWQFAPCWLSYYNAAVGGLSGANQLGLPTTYWGDSLTRELLRQTANKVPPNSTVAVSPVLHQFQLTALESQCPSLRERSIHLAEFDAAAPAEYLLVFYRQEYLDKAWRPVPPQYHELATVTRQGVVLAALYQRQSPP